MKYMVIEIFRTGSKEKVYARYEAKGRMLPDELKYVDSWLTEDGTRCFQLMATDDSELFNLWIEKWSDLVEFEIIPVLDSPTKESNMRLWQTPTAVTDTCHHHNSGHLQ